MDPTTIEQGAPDYPHALTGRLGAGAPPVLYGLGNTALLGAPLLGLVCSITCPGAVVIKTLDAVRALRDAGVILVGGFHSPMERECLDVLLRGNQGTVLCPARCLVNLRMGAAARAAVKDGRLLVLSMFGEKARRTTAQTAAQRNELVAALADVVLAPYARPGGRTWATVEEALGRKQRVLTFDVKDNAVLIGLVGEKGRVAGAEGLLGAVEQARTAKGSGGRLSS
jgi:predicted Rossmann fold nucleotide-binding protein DprA/Smf involved in DNA uptake